MIRKLLLLLFILLFISNSILCQQKGSYFIFAFSNDFLDGSDQYFTNGFHFEFFDDFLKPLPINFLLFPNFPDDIFLTGITLNQNIYTPAELTNLNIKKHDRPFAGYVFVGLKKIAVNDKHHYSIISEMRIGIIGPSALGQQTQNGIHKLLPTSSFVYGWENQIADDFCINYNLKIDKLMHRYKLLDIIGVFAVEAGNPFTSVSTGSELIWGTIDKFNSCLGFDDVKNIRFEFSCGFFAKYVFYDATIQGGLFNKKNIHVLDELIPLQAEMTCGFRTVLKNIRLEFKHYYISPEFDKGRCHKWSELNFLLKF